MTILESIRGKPGTKAHTAQAPDVLRKLRVAEAELAELETQHGNAALDAVIGDAGAQGRLDTLTRNLASGRDKVATLKAAHHAAIERDEAAVRSQREAIRKTQFTAMKQHLAARDAAAVAFSAAIAEAAKQYHTLLDRSAKARAACPIGETWPYDTLCEIDPLRLAVEHEIFRVSATPGDMDGRSLPGARLPDVKVQWQPEATVPLADKIKKASAYTIAKLTGKAPE
jgi:hypothetical protein